MGVRFKLPKFMYKKYTLVDRLLMSNFVQKRFNRLFMWWYEYSGRDEWELLEGAFDDEDQDIM